MEAETHYADSEGVSIAYQVHGEGPLDLVLVPGFVSQVELRPARAIRCASAVRDEVAGLGIEVRAGIHTGEVELIGDDVGGMAVNIGARIGALADPGEVLVSSTVRELVVGSGLEFADRGVEKLKGAPGEWRLFAVDSPPT